MQACEIIEFSVIGKKHSALSGVMYDTLLAQRTVIIA